MNMDQLEIVVQRLVILRDQLAIVRNRLLSVLGGLESVLGRLESVTEADVSEFASVITAYAVVKIANPAIRIFNWFCFRDKKPSAHERKLEHGFRLLDLPPEVQTLVLSHLTSGELTRVRLVSRAFDSHAKHLLSARQQRLSDRIRKSMEEEARRVPKMPTDDHAFLNFMSMTQLPVFRKYILFSRLWLHLRYLALTYEALNDGSAVFVSGQILDEVSRMRVAISVTNFTKPKETPESFRISLKLNGLWGQMRRTRGHFINSVVTRRQREWELARVNAQLMDMESELQAQRDRVQRAWLVRARKERGHESTQVMTPELNERLFLHQVMCSMQLQHTRHQHTIF